MRRLKHRRLQAAKTTREKATAAKQQSAEATKRLDKARRRGSVGFGE